MVKCEDCQNINNMSKECKLNKPQHFDAETKTVRPVGDCDSYSEKEKLYVIKWSRGHGCTISGTLSGNFKSETDAQRECDIQNKLYNSVKHWVEKVSGDE